MDRRPGDVIAPSQASANLVARSDCLAFVVGLAGTCMRLSSFWIGLQRSLPRASSVSLPPVHNLVGLDTYGSTPAFADTPNPLPILYSYSADLLKHDGLFVLRSVGAVELSHYPKPSKT